MADGAMSCFTSLLDSVPGWIAELEDILKAAAVTQDEICFANNPFTSARTESKSSSLRSSRSRDGDNEFQAQPARQRTLLRPALRHLTDSDALRMSQRKRKTSSVLSGQGSGPSALRPKFAAVVYYDGNTQKRFEKLVRTIGTSRNAIRKGKMSAKVDSLARTGSSSSDASSDSGSEDIARKLNYRTTRPSRMASFGRDDGSEVFDRIDGHLEKAQGFCERAAHQVLRDGDCTLEVSQAKERFAEALLITETELPGLRKRAEKAVERQRRSDERRRMEEAQEARRKAAALALKARLEATVAMIEPSDGSLEVDALEADDSGSDAESSYGELNVASLQFGKLQEMRTTRLGAAH